MLNKALQGSFFLYLFSLPLSMAGMEIFSWLSMALLLVCIFAHPDFRTNQLKKLKLTHCLYALPFIALAFIGTTMNPNIDWPKKLYIFGEMRWFFQLLGIPILLVLYKKNWESFFKVFTVVLGIVGIYSIIQVFTGIDVFRSAPYEPNSLVTLWRAKGFFDIMTYSHSMSNAAIFLFAAILIPWENKFRKILIPCALLLYISLILTFTRGTWISLFTASVLIAIFIDKRKASIFIASFFTICIGFAFALEEFRLRIIQLFEAKDVSSMMRVNLWKANWAIFKDHPIWGVGFEQNSQYLETYYERLGLNSNPNNLLISHSHNTYLSLLGGMGLPGLLAYLLFVGAFFLLAFKVWRDNAKMTPFEKIISIGALGAMINFHIGGMTECNFLDGEVLHGFIVICALTIAVYNRKIALNLKGRTHAY